MPGMFSTIFDPTDSQSQHSGFSSDHDAGEANAHTDLSPGVHLESDTGGSYQNLDGSTTTWSHHGEVNATIDVDTVIHAGAEHGAEDFLG